jgi:sphinganine-1-phosphate aldolase
VPLPAAGRSARDVAADLEARRVGDVDWRHGRAFSLAYHAGEDILAVATDAYARFLTENALNTGAFPSLRALQADVVDIVSSWLHGGDAAAGFMTSGGTESILLAVLAARERGRTEHGVGQPNMVLPASAHAAFEKAAHYFGVESRRMPVADDWRADPVAMAAALDDASVLVVASAPQYPQGVVDPVAAVAALAGERGISCHVDACMGGVTLPYLERLGHLVAPFDFRVDGVTSMSVDLHKYAYTAKGASVVLYRTKQLRQYQTFVTENWLGGVYGSSGIQGTKSGGAMAAAWAVLQYVGDDGYLALTASARRAAQALATAIAAVDGLVLRAWPDTTLIAFGAEDPAALDVFAVADALRGRGWYVDRQGPPPSLHCTVTAGHEAHVDAFVAALQDAVDDVRRRTGRGTAGAYGTVD